MGHETDFTIADFCADVRAPTPTAAAELVAAAQALWLDALGLIDARLNDAIGSRLDVLGQRLDLAAGWLGRPSGLVARQRLGLAHHAQRLQYAVATRTDRLAETHRVRQATWPLRVTRSMGQQRECVERIADRLKLLDPALVLQRGYALLADPSGRAITSTRQLAPGNAVRARLADGTVDMTVTQAEETRPRLT